MLMKMTKVCESGSDGKRAIGKAGEPLAERIIVGGGCSPEASSRLISLAKDQAGEADYLAAISLIRQGADISAKDAEGKTAHDHYAAYCERNPDHEALGYPNSALLEAVLRKGDILSDPDFNPAWFA